jgi:hypothetical protein
MQDPNNLRDWFAGMALQALIVGIRIPQTVTPMDESGGTSRMQDAVSLTLDGVNCHMQTMVEHAYLYADEMLRQRARDSSSIVAATGPGPGRDG